MADREPVSTTLAAEFSDPAATPRSWAEARETLRNAGAFMITTVRPEGRPHSVTLLAVWHDGAVYFVTGPHERNAKNLALNPECILSTSNGLADTGFDIVVEGRAVRVLDETLLAALAGLWKVKYGWSFQVHDGAFWQEGDQHEGYVFEVAPVTAFGFGKGEPYSQTRWKFDGTNS